MGERKGSWKQCFCCAGSPQTKSSIRNSVDPAVSRHCRPQRAPKNHKSSVNISNAEPQDPAEEAEEIKQQFAGDSFYTEVQVQTSNVEIPPGDRWRWSRLQTEVQVQTSNLELPGEETFLPFESEAHVQTSDLGTSEEETSLPSQTEAQVQTSHVEVLYAETLFPIESEPLEQTSDLNFQDMHVKNLFSLFVEAEVQTSYVDIPAGNKWRSARLQAEAQVQTSNHELLNTFSSISQKEAEVQTSKLSVTGQEETPFSPSQTEVQVQTSKLALTEMEEEAPFPIGDKPVPTTQSEAAVQTSYVDIPAGNKWRLARLQAEAQVQTSNHELLKTLSSISQKEAEVQTSKLSVTGKEETPFSPSQTEVQEQTSKLALTEEEKAPFLIEDKPVPTTQSEAAVQTSYVDIPAGHLSRLHAEAKVQTSSAELLKRLSSPSLTEAQVQTSKLAVTEVPLSPSLVETQVQTSKLVVREVEEKAPFPTEEDSLIKTVAEAAVQTSYVDTPAGNKWRMSRLQAEAQVQTSSAELLKRLSSPSLTEAQVQTAKVSLTEVEEVPLCPMPTEVHVQTSKLAITEAEKEEASFPVELKPAPQILTEAAMQTSYVDTPAGNKWRMSRLQAEAQVQTSSIELPKTFSSPLLTEAQVQTSKLAVTEVEEVPLSSSLTEAQVQTSKLAVTEAEMAFPAPPETEICTQPSFLKAPEVGEEVPATPAKEKPLPLTLTEAQTQTSYIDIPAGNQWCSSRLQIEAQVQTSRLELPEVKEKFPSPSQTQPEMQTAKDEITKVKAAPPTSAEHKILDEETPKEEVELKLPLSEYAEAEVQTSLVDIPAGKKWRSSRLGTEAQVQTSYHEFPVAKSKTLSPQGTGMAKKVTDSAASKRPAKAPARAAPISVHLHVKMTPRRRNGNKKT